MFVTAEVFKILLLYLAQTNIRVRPLNSTQPFLSLTFCLGQGQVILCHLNPCLNSAFKFSKVFVTAEVFKMPL